MTPCEFAEAPGSGAIHFPFSVHLSSSLDLAPCCRLLCHLGGYLLPYKEATHNRRESLLPATSPQFSSPKDI